MFLSEAGSCASYLFGCTSHNKLAVIDPHVDFVDDYLSTAEGITPAICTRPANIASQYLAAPLTIRHAAALQPAALFFV